MMPVNIDGTGQLRATTTAAPLFRKSQFRCAPNRRSNGLTEFQVPVPSMG